MFVALLRTQLGRLLVLVSDVRIVVVASIQQADLGVLVDLQAPQSAVHLMADYARLRLLQRE